MFRSALILFTITACGTLDPSDTGHRDQAYLGTPSFCSRLQAHSAALKEVLSACPGSGDENIYGFDRESCDAKAPTACSASGQAQLLATGDCDDQIAVCTGASDRSRVVQAISACAEGSKLSYECASAISP